jgi:hypothetical protein
MMNILEVCTFANSFEESIQKLTWQWKNKSCLCIAASQISGDIAILVTFLIEAILFLNSGKQW